MNGLLESIVESHGGLDRWRRFNRVEATIVTGGAFWGMKNLTQDQDPRRMTVSLHEERASVAPFGDPDWHTEFTPDRIAILRDDGTVVAERDDPRTSFAGHEMTTPWDPLHRVWRQLLFPVDDNYFSRMHKPIVIQSRWGFGAPFGPARRDSSGRSIPGSRSDAPIGRSRPRSSSRP